MKEFCVENLLFATEIQCWKQKFAKKIINHSQLLSQSHVKLIENSQNNNVDGDGDSSYRDMSQSQLPGIEHLQMSPIMKENSFPSYGSSII